MNIRSYLMSAPLLSVALTPAVGIAQQNPDVPTITVMTFQGNEQGLGAQAADELRNHLADEFSSKDLYTVPTTDIQTNLESSGFSIQDPLAPTEERQLANMVRADMYVTGKITYGTDDRYRFEPRLVLPHDLTAAQPLPMVEKKDLGDVMGITARAIRDAIKQLPGTKRCEGLLRDKPADAIAAARAAVTAYPRATIARNCMARAYIKQLRTVTTAADSAMNIDSILTVSRAILVEDSLNINALRYSAAFYKTKGDSANERKALLNLVRADPDNAAQVRDVIFQLAGENRITDALPLLKDMVAKNPNDTAVLRLAFLVYTTANDWQSVTEIGTELARADTTAADSVYFTRMASAYDNLKQPQAATDILTQATAKYPNSSYFWLYYANELRQSNQMREAISAYQRYISLGSKDRNYLVIAYLQLGKLYDTTDAFDSLYSLVQRASTLPGLDTAQNGLVAALALSYGNKLFQAEQAKSPAPPGVQVRNDLQNALKFIELANQISPSVNAQFLMGAANFQIMQSATTDAGAEKSCALSRLAQQSLTDAKTQLQAGAANPAYQGSANDMLGYLPKFTPAIAQYIKQYCK